MQSGLRIENPATKAGLFTLRRTEQFQEMRSRSGRNCEKAKRQSGPEIP